MYRSLILAFILLIFNSCLSDDTVEIDCSTVLCAGAPNLILNFMDEEDGESYFADQDINMNAEGLTLRRASNGEELVFGQSYGFLDTQELLIFQYQEPIIITLEDEFETTISADVVVEETDFCCPPIDLENIELSDGTFELQTEEFLYRLIISI